MFILWGLYLIFFEFEHLLSFFGDFAKHCYLRMKMDKLTKNKAETSNIYFSFISNFSIAISYFFS